MSYEKETKADGAIEHKYFISVGGGVVAQVKQTGTATSVNYFHQDALGSTKSVTNDDANTLAEPISVQFVRIVLIVEYRNVFNQK